MIPQSQLPTDASSPSGGCLRGCIASLLEEDIADVPNFTDCEHEAKDASGCWLLWHHNVAEWLYKRSLAFIEIPLSANFPWIGIPVGSVEAIFIGRAPGGQRHAVVGRLCEREFQLVFDPNPEGKGIDAIDAIVLLVPFSPPKEKRIITFP